MERLYYSSPTVDTLLCRHGLQELMHVAYVALTVQATEEAFSNKWLSPYKGGFGAHIPLYDNPRDVRRMHTTRPVQDLVLLTITFPLRHLRVWRSAGVANRDSLKWKLFDSLDLSDYRCVWTPMSMVDPTVLGPVHTMLAPQQQSDALLTPQQ